MRRLALIALILLPLSAGAQEFAARSSVGADYKIVKGLHLGVEEEVRIDDGFSGLEDMRTTVDLSYKLNKHFKFGGGYTLINPYKLKTASFGAERHRLFLDATASYRAGDFQLSLKEKLQFTHRTDDSLNVYQKTRNALSLKSRVGVKYKGFQDWEPFVFFEARTALNDPWGTVSGSVQYTETAGRPYYSYTHTGYTHVYFNRFRLNLGTDWAPSKHHNITFGLLADYCSDYEIDTNGISSWSKKGVRLFADETGWVDTFRLSLCVGYQYKF
ncbi:MAG: DUF2490 domain-containing protein [Bacteroidales bacterium]|nr:DUF2490 domain-containing protein [Bacteroidales bacterium]